MAAKVQNDREDEGMRDEITFNSTVKKIGNGWFIPIRTADKDRLGVDKGDDVEVHIIVMERKGGSE